MKTRSEAIINNKVNNDFNFYVRISEKRRGFFVLHPVGPIDTLTTPILQKRVEQILQLEPDTILFDMKQVDYINFQGLSVIFKAQQAMTRRSGSVALRSFQPHIKKVFDIINALPKEQIFANQHELDSYLDTMQARGSDYRNDKKLEMETDNYIIWAENSNNQGSENSRAVSF